MDNVCANGVLLAIVVWIEDGLEIGLPVNGLIVWSGQKYAQY